MKPSLQARLGQHVTMTPQLRQAIRLLQLSGMELEAEIDLALQSNPMLERAEDIDRRPNETNGAGQTPEPSQAGDTQSPEQRESEPAQVELAEPEPAWEAPSQGGRRGEEHDPADYLTAEDDLHDHLLWQLHLSAHSERDRRIGAMLIEAIDEDGYLRADLEEIRAALRPEIEAGADEMLAVLCAIQHFEPAGVGARSLCECLSAQLALLPAGTPALDLAKTLAADQAQLEALARWGAARLAQRLARPAAELDAAVALLRSLDPRPGARFSTREPEYVRPDCVCWRERGVWLVALARGAQPRLEVSQHYRSLIASVCREDAAYLRGHLQEARWLLRSLDTRAQTLLKVARCIVRQQSAFLEHGPEAMRPLTLREVAAEVELHESTVSRASARKYLLTPRGTFEFKHFFSSGVVSESGGTTSATAIQAMLKRLIEGENPRQPLSDARLALELKAAGVAVARRTVAKYREAMNIPASNERQRLG